MGSNNTDVELTPPKKLFTLTEDHLTSLSDLLDHTEGQCASLLDKVAPKIEEIVGAAIVADRKAIAIEILEALKKSRPGLEYSVVGNAIRLLIPQ